MACIMCHVPYNAAIFFYTDCGISFNLLELLLPDIALMYHVPLYMYRNHDMIEIIDI